MAFIATTDGAKAFLSFNSDIGTWGNTLWFSKPGYTLNQQQALADLVKGEWVDHWVDYCAEGVSLAQVYVYDMRTYDGPVVQGAGPTGTGDVIAETLPLSVSLVATLRTAQRGRAYRGRLFVAGLAEPQLDEGVFDNTIQENLLDFLTAFISTIYSAGWNWCVHQSQVNEVTLNPQTCTPITTVSVRSGIPGSQRRRLRRP
jgi:hypothetical protein